MKKFSPQWWAAQRPEVIGKATESLVEAELNILNARQDFAWHRFPDSKSSRGLVKAQPSDYLIVNHGIPIFLEVKALKEPKRLSKTRITQLTVLKKFDMAGAQGYVLVHQYLLGLWRVIPVREMPFGEASWDVTKWMGHPDLESAMEALIFSAGIPND
jgi:hypothetical protein